MEQNTHVEEVKRVRMNLMLSASTHQKIKAWCASRGVSIQSELEKLLDNAFGSVETRKASS
jgi:hypothetical protein